MKNTKVSHFLLPLLVVMSLMFFWNLCRNINDILIPHLKRACQLTDLQSSLVQSAFFGAYFLLALPAGQFIHRFGYKSGMLIGLLLAAAGAALFLPAANTRYYPLFLGSLFVMASGFAFLEVTATPYISKLGDSESAAGRLSLSAAMGSVGATLAPYISSLLLLHEKDIPQATIHQFTPIELENFLSSEASLVKLPYLTLALLFVLLVAVLFFIKLPPLPDESANKLSFKKIFQFSHTVFGAGGVFCYVAAEVGIVSFMIRFAGHLKLEGLTEQRAALFITLFMGLVLLGRLAGAYLLKRFPPKQMLLVSAGGAFILVGMAIIVNSYLSLWALAFAGLFTSVMYPLIFTLSIKNLGDYTKTASSLLIMAIVGGAVIPPMMGYISDTLGIRWSYSLPALCYVYVIFYALKWHVVNKRVVDIKI